MENKRREAITKRYAFQANAITDEKDCYKLKMTRVSLRGKAILTLNYIPGSVTLDQKVNVSYIFCFDDYVFIKRTCFFFFPLGLFFSL